MKSPEQTMMTSVITIVGILLINAAIARFIPSTPLPAGYAADMYYPRLLFGQEAANVVLALWAGFTRRWVMAATFVASAIMLSLLVF